MFCGLAKALMSIRTDVGLEIKFHSYALACSIPNNKPLRAYMYTEPCCNMFVKFFYCIINLETTTSNFIHSSLNKGLVPFRNIERARISFIDRLASAKGKKIPAPQSTIFSCSN